MRITAVISMMTVVLAAAALPLPAARAQGMSGPSAPERERFLVFTDGDATVGAAVRSTVQWYGGQVADEVRVAPDLALIVVSIPPSAAADLAAISGVREVVRETAPAPSGEALPREDEGVDAVPSTCDGPDGAGHGSREQGDGRE